MHHFIFKLLVSDVWHLSMTNYINDLSLIKTAVAVNVVLCAFSLDQVFYVYYYIRFNQRFVYNYAQPTVYLRV